MLVFDIYSFPKVAVVIATIVSVASAVAIGALSVVYKFIPSLSIARTREG